MNFTYLIKKPTFAEFAASCIDAEKSLSISYSTAAMQTRRALELAVKWVFSYDSDLTIPYQDNLSSLIHDNQFKTILDSKLFPRIRFIVDLGNKAAHTAKPVSRQQAIQALRCLYDFISWIDYSYSQEIHTAPFDETILPDGEATEAKSVKMQQELEKLQKALAEKDKKLEELLKSNEIRLEYRNRREQNCATRDFNPDDLTEYSTRKIYIDLALELAGWSKGKNWLEEVEVTGMPNQNNIGKVDYVLYGENGKPVAVIEAKRTSVDPNAGKIQAKLYAECIEKQYGYKPFIFYTNGFTTKFWDSEFYPERLISGFFTPAELAWFKQRNRDKSSLTGVSIKDELTDRPYQKKAIQKVCDLLQDGHRKALLVMATGTGKTRIAMSLIDVLIEKGWVKNVLFLADRRELVKQAKKKFNELLPDLSICNLLQSKENPESRMIFSTYPTMMNAIDSAHSKDGSQLFTPGHFDLIIVDEAHRSIYKKYQDIFDYFDGFLVGLTATPTADIDHNTYRIFELEDNVPTYAYELGEAVDEKYLVNYSPVETPLKFLEEGISYDELPENEKQQWEEMFGEELDYIPSSELNHFLFNENTVDIVLQNLMEKGIKVQGGECIGKTIIFTANTKHADFILERFNKLYPSYHGDFASCIYNGIKYVDSEIDNFSTKDKLPQIAISVDMLDTGIDIPEIVNLVFFKKVRSKVKFWQMIGRGTRLCKDLFGIGCDKKEFYIFDHCGNFEFFRITQKFTEGKTVKSLTEQLFLLQTRIAKELQHLQYQSEHEKEFRLKQVQDLHKRVCKIKEDLFSSRLRIAEIHRYKQKERWENITEEMINELDTGIAPIVLPTNENELAKRFDLLMYTIIYASLQGLTAPIQQKKVVTTAEALAKIGNIEKVRLQAEIIERVQKPEFWAEATLFDYEEVRTALRDLIELLEYEKKGIYYTNFTDEMLPPSVNAPPSSSNDFRSYRKKVDSYLKDHGNDTSVYKLRYNKELTKKDIQHLEKILWKELGTEDEYRKEFGDEPLVQLVAGLVGMDRNTANELFSGFLSDNTLNGNQMEFVNMVVDHVVANGFLDKSSLNNDPFDRYGDLATLFDGKIDRVKGIVSLIDKISGRFSVAS